MKKLIIAVMFASATAMSHAATVGWSNMGLADYNGDKYQMFVIGQKNVSSVATITALLDEGKSVDSYAIGGGTVNAGKATVASASSGFSIDETGSYTAFMVLFDAASPVSGTTKYAVLEGGNQGTGYTQTIAATTAAITFAGGNAASMISAGSWKTFGGSAPVPEPTGAMLMLLGMAGLALKRKRA